MKPRRLKTGLAALLLALNLIGSYRAEAVPPEGLEAYGILGGGQSKSSVFYSNIGYVNPNFSSDYEAFQVYGGSANSNKDFISYGASATVGNKAFDRDAYFLRYDWIFWHSSFGVKWAHEDWKYLGAGKNTIAIDFNSALSMSKYTGAYISVGGHYRWINYRWNSPSWSPLTYSGEDHQLNLQGCMGLILPGILGTSFITLDINNKDVFTYTNLDNVALDSTLNWGSESLLFRLTSGIRYTGVSGVAPDVGDIHIYLGFIYSH